MPRQRFIWPTLWDDPDLGRVSPMARLLYIGCFSLADDDGRIHGEAEFLKGAIFRYQRLSFDAIRKLRAELEQACSNFVVYEAHGNTYIQFTNWCEFQKPKYPKPSKLPPPPRPRKRAKVSTGGKNASVDAINDPGKVSFPQPPSTARKARKPASQSQKLSGNDSGKLPEAFRERSPIGLGREGKNLKALAGSKPKGVAEGHTLESLPLNIAYEVMQIVKRTHGADEGSTEVLAKLAATLPQATLADVRSRCTGKHIGWAVSALKAEVQSSHPTKGAA